MTTKNLPPKMALPRTTNHYQELANETHQEFLAAPTTLREATLLQQVGCAVTAVAFGISLAFIGAPSEAAPQPIPVQTIEQ
ncbi:MAG: hypothetical protein JWO41_53 [Candidatus Saccharibacteria bacterium]|nr:hypothetical protein [Candidatus Saccharibacteria bacterium]